MSYIPDVREAKVRTMKDGKHVLMDNPYWEGNLNDKGRIMLNVFDMCMEDVELFFTSLESYRDELLEAGFDPYMIDDEVIKADKDLDEFSPEELRGMSRETKIALALGNALLQNMEATRNDWVIGMLEDLESWG